MNSNINQKEWNDGEDVIPGVLLVTTSNLRYDTVVDQLMKILQTDHTILYLKLCHTHIGYYGFNQLMETLKTNTTLIGLKIANSSLMESHISKLCDSLKFNSTLKNLNLARTNLKEKSATLLLESLKEIPGITKLNLKQNDNIGPKIVQKIAELLRVNTSITDLNLSTINLGDGIIEICESLKSNTTLKKCNLSSNYIFNSKSTSLKIASVLELNSTLTNLNLSLNDLYSKVLIEGLKLNKSITALDLSDNKICSHAAPKFAELLKINSSLTKLNISNNNLLDVGCIIESLKINSSLIHLNLSRTLINPEGILKISEVLKINTTLKILKVNDCGINDKESDKIAESLKTNCSLRELHIHSNRNITFNGYSNLEASLKLCYLTRLKYANFTLLEGKKDPMEIICQFNKEYLLKWKSGDFHSVYQKYCWKIQREDLIPIGKKEKISCLWIYWLLRHYFIKDIVKECFLK